MAIVETIKIEGDSTSAVKAMKAVEVASAKTQQQATQSSEAIKSGFEAIDKRTGGAVSGFKALSGGLKSIVSGFGTLRGAIAATGIGALLLAITSLVSYFTKTERGADQLRIITSALRAVMGKLTDVVIHFGEVIFEAFQNPKKLLTDFGNLIKENINNRIEGLLELFPALSNAMSLLFKGEFKEAGKVAADAVAKVGLGVENITDKIGSAVESVVDFGKSLSDAANEGARIAKIFNQVEKAERELIVQRAKANKGIQEARFIADDLTKSTEERIAAVLLAGKIEDEVAAKELKTAKAKALALKEQADISESDKETLKEIAEAQARVEELETASIARKRRLGMEVKSLREEEKRLAEEKIKSEQELAAFEQQAAEAFRVKQLEQLDKAYELLITDQQREINAVRDKYFALLQLEQLNGEERAALTEKQNSEIAAIEEKYAQSRIAQEKAIADAKSATINQSIDSVQGALGSLFAKSKGVATANVLVDSAQAAVGIFKNSTSLPEPFGSINRGIQLAALAATTYASIRSINAAQPGSSDTASISQLTQSSAIPQSPQFNVVGQGGINQLAASVNSRNQQPIQAYVVAGQVTSAQQLARRRARTATFG